MNTYTLILCFDGDILIVKDGTEEQKEIYHKSYNMGEDLKENLLEAFKVYESLTNFIKVSRKIKK